MAALDETGLAAMAAVEAAVRGSADDVTVTRSADARGHRRRRRCPTADQDPEAETGTRPGMTGEAGADHPDPGHTLLLPLLPDQGHPLREEPDWKWRTEPLSMASLQPRIRPFQFRLHHLCLGPAGCLSLPLDLLLGLGHGRHHHLSLLTSFRVLGGFQICKFLRRRRLHLVSGYRRGAPDSNLVHKYGRKRCV